MFNLGAGEVLVIALVALVVLGPERLPGVARDVGKFLTEIRSMSKGFQDELRHAVDIEAMASDESDDDRAVEAEAFKRGEAHAAQRPGHIPTDGGNDNGDGNGDGNDNGDGDGGAPSASDQE